MTSGQYYYEDDEPAPRRYRSLQVPDRSTFGEPPIQDYSTGRRKKKRRSIFARLFTLIFLLLVAGGIGLGILFRSGGERIQRVVDEKSNVVDVRAATVIDLLYAVILFVTVFGLASIYVKALNKVKER